MATEYSRMLLKRSNVTLTVPTIPPILDINTFLITDIFPGELFYNLVDNKLFISDGVNIISIATTIGTGGYGLEDALAVSNITNGNNIILSVGDFIKSAADTVNIELTATGIKFNATGGTNFFIAPALIPAYDDIAAAVIAGLVPGDIFQATGGGTIEQGILIMVQ